MNKVILGLILAVCVLGMTLVMLNERLGRRSETHSVATVGTVSTMSENRANFDRPSGTLNSTPSPSAPTIPENPPAATAPEPQGESAREMAAAAIRLEKDEADAALAPPQTLEAPPEIAPVETPSEPALEPGAVRVHESTARDAPQPPEENASESVETKIEPRAEPKAEKPRETKKEPKPVAGPKTITRFVVFSRENGATVRIAGNAPIKYRSLNLDNPNRLVIDLDGVWQFPAAPGIPKNDLVSAVRIGKQGNDKTRVVIDLKGKPRIARVVPSRGGEVLDARVDK